MSEIRTAIPEEIDKYLDSLVRTGPFASKAELVRAALVSFANTAGPLATGFDRENVVAPDGRIYQLEYAREGAMRGAPGVGVTYDKGVVLVGMIPTSSPLVRSVAKVHRMGDRLALMASGIMSDAHMLARHVHQAEPNSNRELIDILVETYWEHAVSRTRRPLSTALLVGTALEEEPKLLEFDPSGAWLDVSAAAVGSDHERLREVLERKYRLGSAKDAEKLALETLGNPPVYDLAMVPVK
ncbi:MAG: hypothetical protein ACE5JE_09355 [Thermoplasmata archaeon]